MTTQSEFTNATLNRGASVFDRILVGVDGSKESLDACRQAVVLAEPGAVVEAAVVSLFPVYALPGEGFAGRLERAADAALSTAAEILGSYAQLRRLEGLTVDALLEEVSRFEATLLAIGTEGHRRFEEIVLGGNGGELLHKAPCAVFVARPVPDLETFPREIVVGIDGSAASERAVDAARRLATRRHSTLRRVVAHGGRHVDLGEIAHRHPRVQAVAGAPVPALVEASSCADLLVVGSRGLHGVRALGSVSERVAHQARCSVLVVR